MAHAFTSLAHFNHSKSENAIKCLETLIKVSIRYANYYNIQTLAVISNSLAELDIQNSTFFTILKNIIMTFEKRETEMTLGEESDPNLQKTHYKHGENYDLSTMDCA